MTVAINFRTEMRPYSGYDEPQLPIGAWIAAGDVVGDASGQFVQINFLFQFGNQALNPNLFNVERFTAEVSANTTQRANIQTRQMDNLAPGRPVGVQRWDFEMAGDGVSNAIINSATQSGLPMWLGQCQEALLECGVRFQFVNTNLLTFTVRCQGYVWGPRSILAPGGPQRPPFGFLGN